ncbi:MAG: hypothetical protein AAGF73_18805 [Actinomycetota bacterium]
MRLADRLSVDLADLDPLAPEPTRFDGMMPVTASPTLTALCVTSASLTVEVEGVCVTQVTQVTQVVG